MSGGGLPLLLSAGAFRGDGRRPEEIRALRCSTCCSPLPLRSLSASASSQDSSPTTGGSRSSSSNSSGEESWSTGNSSSVEDNKRKGNSSSSGSSSSDGRGEVRVKRATRMCSRKPLRIAAAAVSAHNADGRGIVSLGSTKVAVFVFGPRPLLRGGGGAAAAVGGPWSGGTAGASSFLRAAEEVEAGSGSSSSSNSSPVGSTGGASAAGGEGAQQDEEEGGLFFSDRFFDAYGSASAATGGGGGGEGKTALLLCRAGIAPFSTGEVGSSSERRTVAAGVAPEAAGSSGGGGSASAAAAAFVAAAAAGGGGGSGGGGSQQEQELALSVRKVLQGVVLGECHPRAAIYIFIHVLEDDGGMLAASVCAAGLALIEAGVAMRDFVAAVSCLCPPRPAVPLVDPCRAELQGNIPTMTVALLPSTEEVVWLQLNGKVSAAVFDEMYAVAVRGCREIAAVMRVRCHASSIEDGLA